MPLHFRHTLQFFGVIVRKTGIIRTSPRSAGSASQGLTNSLEQTKERLVMNATRKAAARANTKLARVPKKPFEIPDRVASRAANRWIAGENGCRISTYSVGSHGYAQIGWQDPDHRHVVTAHRAAWVWANGQQIPVGMTIDHLCKNRRCVNPDHLRLISNFENARRTSGSDWQMGMCKHGHPNSEIRYQPSGKAYCGICSKEWSRRARVRKAESRKSKESQAA